MDVKKKVKPDVFFVAAAIEGLRKRLGLTQEQMAREIGCPVASYVRWEKGRSEPGSTWLLVMLQMCPDEECVAAFGLASGSPAEMPSAPAAKGPIKEKEHRVIEKAEDITDPEVREVYRRIVAGLHHLEAEKAAGNRVAAELLDSIGETIMRAAAIVRSPDVPRGRRAKALQGLLREISLSEGVKRPK